jgi:5-methylcytosine-specific restriction endonuclease McrA
LTHNIPARIDTDATIEHLHSRNQFPNGRPNVENTIVIACKKCNEGRAAAEVRGLGIYRLRELAGRWPREYERKDGR